MENAHEDLAAQRELEINSSTGPPTKRADIRAVAAISLAVLLVAASFYAFIRAQKARVQPRISSAGSSTIRLSTLLQARTAAFLSEYPVEKRIRYYNEWLRQYPAAPIIKRAICYSFLADDYALARRNWPTVAETIRQAAVLYRQAIQSGLNEPGDLALAYVSAASSEEKLGNSAGVVELLTKGLATSSELRDGGYAPEAYRMLASAYSNQKKYGLSDATYNQALKAQTRNNFSKMTIAMTTLFKATNLYKSKKSKEAKACLLQAQKLAADARDTDAPPQTRIQWLRDYGLAYRRMDEPARALQLLSESRELAAKAHLPDEEDLNTSLIAECQVTMGNRDAAMKEYQTLSRTPSMARLLLRDLVYGAVKASVPDQPMVGDVQKSLLAFPQQTDRQEFIAELTGKDLSDLSTKQQQRFNALVKDFQEFVDRTKQ